MCSFNWGSSLWEIWHVGSSDNLQTSLGACNSLNFCTLESKWCRFAPSWLSFFAPPCRPPPARTVCCHKPEISLLPRIFSRKKLKKKKHQISSVWTRWQCGGSSRRSWRLIGQFQSLLCFKSSPKYRLNEIGMRKVKPAQRKRAYPPRPAFTVLNSWWIISRLQHYYKKTQVESCSPGAGSNSHWEQQPPCTTPPRPQSRRARSPLPSWPPACSSRMSHGPNDTPCPLYQNLRSYGSLSLAEGYKPPLPEQSYKMELPTNSLLGEQSEKIKDII